MLSKNLATPVADEEIRIETVSAFEDAVKRSFKFKALRILLLVVSFFVAIGALNVLMSAGLGMGNANALTYIQLVLGVAVFVFALKVMSRFGSYAHASGYSDRLRQWIFDNRQFAEEVQVDHKGNRRSVVTDSAVFFVWQDDDFVYVLAKDNNDRYSARVLNMERDDEISRLMKLPLDSVDTDYEGKTYKLRKHPIQRVSYTMSDFQNPREFQGMERYRIPLNSELTWDFAKKNPHALIGGGTGSGKSYSLYGLILNLLERGANVYVCDPKQSDLSMLRFALGDDHVASSPNAIAGICRKVNEVMQERYQEMQKPENFGKDASDLNLAPVVLVFDEVAAYQALADKKVFNEVNDYVKSLVLQGRQALCEVVLCCQQPNAQVISTDIRDNLGLRLLMGNGNSFLKNIVLTDDCELQNVKVKGGGHVFLDGLGWERPRYIEMPSFEPGFDFMEAFKAVSKRNPHYAAFWEGGEDPKAKAGGSEAWDNGASIVGETSLEIDAEADISASATSIAENGADMPEKELATV